MTSRRGGEPARSSVSDLGCNRPAPETHRDQGMPAVGSQPGHPLHGQPACSEPALVGHFRFGAKPSGGCVLDANARWPGLGGGCRMVSVARASIFAGVLGGLDLEQYLADCFRGGLVAGGLVGGAGGQQFGEVVAAAGADDVAGEEPSLAPSPCIPSRKRDGRTFPHPEGAVLGTSTPPRTASTRPRSGRCAAPVRTSIQRRFFVYPDISRNRPLAGHLIKK